jgi:predicted ATPase/transcriptional regulator with XRE-family HTH domain
METNAATTFGDLLRRYRLAAGLTQEQLAERAQVSPRAISDLERGQRSRPWRETIQLLANALDLDPADRSRLEAAARSPGPSNVGTTDPPPAPSSPIPPNNLPTPWSSFIGRERECEEVGHLVATSRLVTLTGAGGSGKTRLALEVARALLPRFRDGVWFVDLAPLSNSDLVPAAVALALGIREEPNQPILRKLLALLRERQALLVLDNCEHLIEACAQVADSVLSGCPAVTILATSREALNLPSGVVWQIHPLSVTSADRPSPSEIGASESGRLFVERARAARPGFVLSDDNATAVALLCRRLDGMPLAIELAAARVRAMSVEQITERLDQRFRLLATGNRAAPTRQQTLEAAIDWSYGLLDETERALFRRLAVFPGSFTLDAIEVVASDGGGTDNFDPGGSRLSGGSFIPDLLSRLVDKSLVLLDERGTAIRYRLLETIRHYAWERLVAADDDTAARDRLGDWCLQLAATAEPELTSRRQAEWLSRLAAENDNLRAALEWYRGQDPADGARLAAILWFFWYLWGISLAGRHWLEVFLNQASEPHTRAKLLVGLSFMERSYGTLERAHHLAEESLAIFRQHGNLHGCGWALHNLGCVDLDTAGHPYGNGKQRLQESVDCFRAIGDIAGAAMSLRDLGMAYYAEGDLATAQATLAQSWKLLHGIGDCWSYGWTARHLAELCRFEGDLERAKQLLEEARARFERIHHGAGLRVVLADLGAIAHSEGDDAQVRALLSAAIGTGPEHLFYSPDAARVLVYLGLLHLDHGEAEQGIVLVAAAAALVAALGTDLLWPSDRVDLHSAIVAARTTLGEENFARAWAKGQSFTTEQAFNYALEN